MCTFTDQDWCPDCHQAAPVLAKAAGERARFFFRDENPDLREAYRLGEKRIVPTLVFLDRELRSSPAGTAPRRRPGPFSAPGLRKAHRRAGKEKRALLAAYHQAFPRMAKAIREEWARLLRRASGPPG
jgi:thiol-disulfide isomerase/thioredoxin